MGNVCCGSSEEKTKASSVFAPSSHLKDDTGSLASGSSSRYQPTNTNTNNNNNFNNNSAATHTLNDLDASAAKPLSVQDHVTANQHSDQQQQQLLFQQQEQEETQRRARQAVLAEQARLEQIVQGIGRGMVAVRSTRGSTGYYDQGFAAALSQHLEQTTRFSPQAPFQLPTTSTTTTTTTTSSSSQRSTTSNVAKTKKTATTTAIVKEDSVYARLSQPPWEGIALHSGGGGGEATAATGAAAGGAVTVVKGLPQSSEEGASMEEATTTAAAAAAPPVVSTDGTNTATTTTSTTTTTTVVEHPNIFFDQVAESFLEEVIPKKERLFSTASPIVETLL